MWKWNERVSTALRGQRKREKERHRKWETEWKRSRQREQTNPNNHKTPNSAERVVCVYLKFKSWMVPVVHFGCTVNRALFHFPFGFKSILSDASTFQPEFAEPILNISVAIGRDATFTCHVRYLGGYRVSIFHLLNICCQFMYIGFGQIVRFDRLTTILYGMVRRFS